MTFVDYLLSTFTNLLVQRTWKRWNNIALRIVQQTWEYHTNNFVIIKQVHFVLIKLNCYDHYFIDVYTFLKKINVSGPRDSKLWV
jgi:hypothetical protein